MIEIQDGQCSGLGHVQGEGIIRGATGAETYAMKTSGLLPHFVSRSEVARTLGISTKTVDRMVGRGKLPKPVALSARCVRFDVIELSAYLEKAKQSNQTQR